MLIDCETCVARGPGCPDCVITVLLNRPPVPVEFDDEEQVALAQLSDAGLLPPLRLVPVLPAPDRPPNRLRSTGTG